MNGMNLSSRMAVMIGLMLALVFGYGGAGQTASANTPAPLSEQIGPLDPSDDCDPDNNDDDGENCAGPICDIGIGPDSSVIGGGLGGDLGMASDPSCGRTEGGSFPWLIRVDDHDPRLTPVFLGTGSAFEKVRDLAMPTNGIMWFHTRSYDSRLSGDAENETEQGWLWRHNLMVDLTEDDADVIIKLDAYTTLEFEYDEGTGTYQERSHKAVTLTHDTEEDAYIVQTTTGNQLWFHDFEYVTADERG